MSPPCGRCQSLLPARAFSRTIALPAGCAVPEAEADAPHSTARLAVIAKILPMALAPFYTPGERPLAGVTGDGLGRFLDGLVEIGVGAGARHERGPDALHDRLLRDHALADVASRRQL